MWAAWVSYPRFRSKNDAVNTMTMRIQGCFRFSMNGTPPPEDGEIMVALQSYIYWLARGAPTGARLQGEGFSRLPEPPEPPSLERGAAVFAADCAACHGAEGEGRRAPGRIGFQFPPLWGARSYNWGAGMTSVATAAAFIRANMPWGLHDALTGQQAWDVAFFLDSHERPQDPRFTGDLVETRARYHDSKWSLYGTVQNGIRLGDPANYPLPEAP
jgi:thiosulfate dehydrogenase